MEIICNLTFIIRILSILFSSGIIIYILRINIVLGFIGGITGGIIGWMSSTWVITLIWGVKILNEC